ncbi:MAG: hypothetical protein WBP93_09200 [Pyrinomonadaceae bacterium]
MKSKRRFLSLLIVALALTAQLTFLSSLTQARQNANSSTTMAQDNRVEIPGGNCRRRCARAYRFCLRSGKNTMACRRHYRNCLRRCPQ